MNLEIYESAIDCETASMISGQHVETVHFSKLPDIATIQAWLADDDLQALTVCSTNIGFIRKFQKRYKRVAEKSN